MDRDKSTKKAFNSQNSLNMSQRSFLPSFIMLLTRRKERKKLKISQFLRSNLFDETWRGWNFDFFTVFYFRKISDDSAFRNFLGHRIKKVRRFFARKAENSVNLKKYSITFFKFTLSVTYEFRQRKDQMEFWNGIKLLGLILDLSAFQFWPSLGTFLEHFSLFSFIKVSYQTFEGEMKWQAMKADNLRHSFVVQPKALNSFSNKKLYSQRWQATSTDLTSTYWYPAKLNILLILF